MKRSPKSQATQIGKAIRALRELSGISQEHLAKTSEVSRATIAALEAGKGDPSIGTIEKIARSMNVSPLLLLLNEHDWRAIGIFTEILALTDFKRLGAMHSSDDRVTDLAALLIWGQQTIKQNPRCVETLRNAAEFGARSLPDSTMIGALFGASLSAQGAIKNEK